MANNTNKARSPTSSPLVHTGIPLVAVALLGLLAAGAYDALHLQLKRSNVRGHLAVLLNPANPVVRSEYTGFAPVDRLLSILVCFFLPIADALESKPELPVFVLQFGGQVVTPVVLQLVEATRAGNKWNPAGFAIVWGLLMQALGYAVAFPLWAIVHLVLSPNDRASLSLRDPARLTAVFPAFLLGYYVPTLLQMAPLPDRAHQTAIALWQPFPIYTGVLAWAFGQMAGRLSPTGGSGMTKAAVDRSAVDTAYNFAVGAGAIAHWATLAIVGAAAVQPELVGGPAVAERLTFVNTFVPYALRTYGTASLAEITFQFLQWDWIFGSAAALVWSTTLAWQVGAWSISVGGIVGIVRDVLLVGPSAAAALIMKRRDAVVYA